MQNKEINIHVFVEVAIIKLYLRSPVGTPERGCFSERRLATAEREMKSKINSLVVF